jgi:hypothetical protein
LPFTNYIDSAASELMQRTFDGKHIKEGTLVVRKAVVPPWTLQGEVEQDSPIVEYGSIHWTQHG